MGLALVKNFNQCLHACRPCYSSPNNMSGDSIHVSAMPPNGISPQPLKSGNSASREYVSSLSNISCKGLKGGRGSSKIDGEYNLIILVTQS